MKNKKQSKRFTHPDFYVVWVGGRLTVYRLFQNKEQEVTHTWHLDEFHPAEVYVSRRERGLYSHKTKEDSDKR